LSLLELLPPPRAFSNSSGANEPRLRSFIEVVRDEGKQDPLRLGLCRLYPAGADPALAAPADSDTAAGSRNLTHEQQQAGATQLPSLAPLAERVLPAVVNISVQLNEQAALQDQSSDESGGSSGDNGGFPQPGTTPFDQFLRRFFQQPFSRPQPGQQIVGLGSGFIIDPRGDIVTNNHVVANADKVVVTLKDQSRYPAKILSRDKKTDLALLKINTDKPLPYVAWGDMVKRVAGNSPVAAMGVQLGT
jgi:S1-C subfamily serine protease